MNNPSAISKSRKSWKQKKQESKKRKEIELLTEATKEKQQKTSSVEDRKGRPYTISIALPGSILDNAQSAELRTYLAGQIARAAAIFQVDEIVVFDEHSSLTPQQFESYAAGSSTISDLSAEHKRFLCNTQLVRILQFLECPQYLRKQLFPLHKDLQYAGLLNPLDCLHHFRSDDLSICYREGVVLDKPTKSGNGAYCNAGLSKEVLIDEPVKPGVRVTLKLENTDSAPKHHYKGSVVSPMEPTKHGGYYWGYTVRLARNIGSVFEDCTFPGGYDLTVGTSDKGRNIVEIDHFPQFKHMLVVFGGVCGLESCVENDETIKEENVGSLFQYYLNTCPDQGSRTIRTEEAILITLSALKPKLKM